MKIQKGHNQDERLILTGMIVNNSVCGCLSSKLSENAFSSRYANLIAKWCASYFEQYRRAPGQRITNLFHHWAEKASDNKTIEMVEDFLEGLSNDYKKLKKGINADFVLDTAKQHFTRVRIQKLAENLEDHLAAGDLEAATQKISEYSDVRLKPDPAINIPNCRERIAKAFDEHSDPLIVYSGALGKFLGDRLERDGFIAFFGPEKRGKSWILTDVAFTAMLQRRRVAFFEAGDMSENQVIRRMMIRIARRPLWPKKVSIPVKIIRNGKQVRVRIKKVRYTRGLNKKVAWTACKKFMETKLKSYKPYLRLSCHPNSTLTVEMIESQLKEWSKEGWVADVVIVDYADIMDMSKGGKDTRDRIDYLWRHLRRLSQTYHSLVVTASQTNKLSYTARTISMSHTSEDKRKLSHVTGCIGLNQTLQEKKKGLMRFNWVVLREAMFLETRCVYVAGCLDIGHPIMLSSS